IRGILFCQPKSMRPLNIHPQNVPSPRICGSAALSEGGDWKGSASEGGEQLQAWDWFWHSHGQLSLAEVLAKSQLPPPAGGLGGGLNTLARLLSDQTKELATTASVSLIISAFTPRFTLFP